MMDHFDSNRDKINYAAIQPSFKFKLLKTVRICNVIYPHSVFLYIFEFIRAH